MKFWKQNFNSWHWLFSNFKYLHRIADWLGSEGTLKLILPLDQIAPSPVQPDLEHRMAQGILHTEFYTFVYLALSRTKRFQTSSSQMPMSLFRAITGFVVSWSQVFIADCFALECWREGARWQGHNWQYNNMVLSINTSLIFSSVCLAWLFKRRIQWLEKRKWLKTLHPSLYSTWVITHPRTTPRCSVIQLSTLQLHTQLTPTMQQRSAFVAVHPCPTFSGEVRILWH